MEHYTLPHRHNQSMSQLMSHLPNIEEFQTTADIFKQLSDPTRIQVSTTRTAMIKNRST